MESESGLLLISRIKHPNIDAVSLPNLPLNITATFISMGLGTKNTCVGGLYILESTEGW
jgi:hypothetical protein